MIKEGIIEEHPPNQPASWVSCAEKMPKSDSSLHINLDACNLDEASISSSYPIPRQEDARAQLWGTSCFSKLDFKSAFWQLELDTQLWALTVFHANNKLYRYIRLIMGVNPAQAELNAALKPIFSHITNVYQIHDDLIIALKVLKNICQLSAKSWKLTNQKTLPFIQTNVLLAKKNNVFGYVIFLWRKKA